MDTTPGTTATTPALDLSTVTIAYPAPSSSNETTNDLTRQKTPESRHWKVSPTITHNGFTRNSILIENVALPYMNELEESLYDRRLHLLPFAIGYIMHRHKKILNISLRYHCCIA